MNCSQRSMITQRDASTYCQSLRLLFNLCYVTDDDSAARSTPHPQDLKLSPLLELRCSNLKDLQQIRAQMIRTGFVHEVPSLATLLALCLSSSAPSDNTSLAYACMVFNHREQPGTVKWNTMLRGLVDCSLPGTVISGYVSMLQDASSIGLLREARNFIEKTPMEPNGAVWGALLSGCRVHNNVDVGENTAELLLEIEKQRWRVRASVEHLCQEEDMGRGEKDEETDAPKRDKEIIGVQLDRGRLD
ncbi:hypothetical protein B296_00000771 [Ensete ventricosum]|uniref:Pentatricopeptide repeat-containing protein n=1 Tax=Ensete ventricosum TaxID=4639 RepID=A0A427B959_ENSVE|nr:hypothetical protein B296_00000771 [Ensete ventricosum]